MPGIRIAVLLQDFVREHEATRGRLVKIIEAAGGGQMPQPAAFITASPIARRADALYALVLQHALPTMKGELADAEQREDDRERPERVHHLSSLCAILVNIACTFFKMTS